MSAHSIKERSRTEARVGKSVRQGGRTRRRAGISAASHAARFRRLAKQGNYD